MEGPETSESPAARRRDPSAGTPAPRRLSFRDRLSTALQPPDRTLIDAGGSGELVVAEIRLVLIAIVFLIPSIQLLQDPLDQEGYVGMGVAAMSLGVAIGVYLALRRNIYRPWIGFVTSVMDVSFITIALLLYLALGRPHIAVNSQVVYPMYLIAITATTLRYDPRICAVTGILAVVQYGSVVAYAATSWDLNDPAYAPFPYGVFDPNTQIARIVLLASAGILSTMVVLRARRLRWLAASDPLTGVMNRGFFDERIEQEAHRAQRYDRRFAILMIDIDHFKNFNDSYGHSAGDEALKSVAETIRDTLRRSDLVGRYGGEEFIVAMPETTGVAAAAKAEKLRQEVADHAVELKGNGKIATTVSIGVAGWPESGPDLRAVIEEADRRLYQAKERGRNRVVGPEA